MSNESVRLITKAQWDEYKKLEEENAELKNLLRECRNELKPLKDDYLFDHGDKPNLSDRFLRFDNLITKIDEVLK